MRNYSETPPAFQGYAILQKWALTNEGMTFIAQLKPYTEIHPFRSFRCGNSGQRFHVAVHAISPVGDHRPLGAWETMLYWWSDDPKQGMKVHLRLHGEENATHPLDGLQKGDEIYMACWLLADDETLDDPVQPIKKKTGWANLKPAQQAYVLSKDADFAQWAFEEFDTDKNEKGAVAAIRAFCGIESRKEFGIDDAAGLSARMKWKEMTEKFFLWKKQKDKNTKTG